VRLGHGGFRGAPRSVERTREYGVPATYDADTEECAPTGDDPGYGGRIAADTEGLTIYETGRRAGTLLVSSQGDDTFYTYDRQTLRPLRHFAVVDGPRADGSQDCDGADTVSTPLPGYPHGLLVVQDGDNTPVEPDADGEPRVNTNFKLLDARVLNRP
jgi:3-phytase